MKSIVGKNLFSSKTSSGSQEQPMRRFIPMWLIGITSIILYSLNTLFWPCLVYVAVLLRFIPIPWLQKQCKKFLNNAATYWSDVHNFIIRLTTQTQWEVKGLENLKTDDWYLLICNHISWVDILALGYVFNRKAPPLKFFMKKELQWTFPFAGLAARFVDFPIMHRYSKEYLAKHPEQKGKDIERTRIACEKFKNIPSTIINYVEGTRFTPEKQQRQASPYRYLLRPKAGGIAFTLATMGECFHKILNVTLIYPDGIDGWQFLCGKTKKVIVNVELLPITPDLLGDYENNRQHRVYFQNWLNTLWQKKDDLIQDILSEDQ